MATYYVETYRPALPAKQTLEYAVHRGPLDRDQLQPTMTAVLEVQNCTSKAQALAAVLEYAAGFPVTVRLFMGGQPKPSPTRKEIGRVEFKIAAVSDNTNSFGLHQVVAVSRNGETWKFCSNSLNCPRVGDVLLAVTRDGVPNWTSYGFEIPEQISFAPANVVRDLWEEVGEDYVLHSK